MASLECICGDDGMTSRCNQESHTFTNLWLLTLILCIVYGHCTRVVDSDSDDEGPSAMYS